MAENPPDDDHIVDTNFRAVESRSSQLKKRRSKNLSLKRNNPKGEEFSELMTRVAFWHKKHEKTYCRFLALLDEDFITPEEFKTCMRTLRAPFREDELDILCELMDTQKDGRVEYLKLSEVVWDEITDSLLPGDDRKNLNVNLTGFWILMTFKLPSMEIFSMSTTFEELVNLDYTGAMLRKLIELRQPVLPSRSLVLFTDPAQFAKTIIHCNQRLSEFNYEGGPRNAPNEGTLFYEFCVGHIDCPLLTYIPSWKNVSHQAKGRKADERYY